MATEEQEDFAALAGVTAAYFKVTPEMWKLFQDALDEQWAPNRLQSAIRNTKWYKKTSQTEREAWLLKSSDKAEYDRRISDMQGRLIGIANQLGFRPPSAVLKQIANQALLRGWNENQIRQNLASKNKAWNRSWQNGEIGGDLREIQGRLQRAAADYGVRVSNAWLSNNLRGILSGRTTEGALIGSLQKYAKSAFPGLSDEIDAGRTVRDVAEPYIQSMAEILEVNPNDIDLFTPEIRNAMSAKDPEGRLGMKSIYDFEREMRRDPRWFKTSNSQNAIMGAGRQVLELMGVVA